MLFFVSLGEILMKQRMIRREKYGEKKPEVRFKVDVVITEETLRDYLMQPRIPMQESSFRHYSVSDFYIWQ